MESESESASVDVLSDSKIASIVARPYNNFEITNEFPKWISM